MASITSHFVCASVPTPSHVTPFVGYAVSLLLRFPGLAITFFVPQNMSGHGRNEIDAQTHSLSAADGLGAESVVERLRLFVFADTMATMEECGGDFVDMMIRGCTTRGCESFPTILQALLNSEEVTDGTNRTYPAIAPPTLVIADLFAIYAGPALKSVAPGLKLLSFFISAAAHAVYFFDKIPGTFGGITVAAQRLLDDPATRGDRTLEQIAQTIFMTDPLDELVQVPGYLDVKAYEHIPQPFLHPKLPKLFLEAQTLYAQTHGTVILSSHMLESETIKYLQSLRPENPVITYLPRVAPPPVISAVLSTEAAVETPASLDRTRVLKFLDGKPANSVLYISFGSLFHPSLVCPDNFNALIETLLEDAQPWSFVMTRGSAAAVIPESLLRRIEESGKGIVVSWAPQREALAHPAVGLMISHGGSGGAFEALSGSVPLIFWPIAADQPAVAALLSSPPHSVAVELVQVRTARGAQPSLPYGIIHGTTDAVKIEVRETLARFWGEKGEQYRQRAGDLGARVNAAKAVGGESYEALSELEKYM